MMGPALYAQKQSLKISSTSDVQSPVNQQSKSLLDLIEQQEDKKSGDYSADLRVEGQHYFTQFSSAENLENSTLFEGHVSAHKKYTGNLGLGLHADITGGTFFNKTQTHLVVHEMYIEAVPPAGNSQSPSLSFGRKFLRWNRLDSDEHLALWQPQFALDTLRPQKQGLTGLFLGFKPKQWDFTLFASPLFIPSLGPEIKEENGSLISESRWYRAPSSKFNMMQSRNNPIVYHLDIPEQKKLVENWSMAALVKYGNQVNAPKVSMALADKPVNELILKRQINVDTSNQATVVVSPDVARHRLYSANVSLKKDDLNFSTSYIEDEPEQKLPEVGWASQSLQPLKIYSGTISLDLKNKYFMGDISYTRMKSFGGEIIDITSNGEADDKTLFDQRLRFKDTSRFEFSGELPKFISKKINLHFSYLYDHEVVGQLVETELNFELKNKLKLIAGADFLGVDNSDTAKESSFLNQFRANDRIYGGMTYAY